MPSTKQTYRNLNRRRRKKTLLDSISTALGQANKKKKRRKTTTHTQPATVHTNTRKHISGAKRFKCWQEEVHPRMHLGRLYWRVKHDRNKVTKGNAHTHTHTGRAEKETIAKGKPRFNGTSHRRPRRTKRGTRPSPHAKPKAQKVHIRAAAYLSERVRPSQSHRRHNAGVISFARSHTTRCAVA